MQYSSITFNCEQSANQRYVVVTHHDRLQLSHLKLIEEGHENVFNELVLAFDERWWKVRNTESRLMFAHYLNGKLEQVTSNILIITSLEKFANVKLNAQ